MTFAKRSFESLGEAEIYCHSVFILLRRLVRVGPEALCLLARSTLTSHRWMQCTNQWMKREPGYDLTSKVPQGIVPYWKRQHAERRKVQIFKDEYHKGRVRIFGAGMQVFALMSGRVHQLQPAVCYHNGEMAKSFSKRSPEDHEEQN